MQHPLDSIRTHLARTYGGKKAFVAAIFHAFRFYSGALNDYAQIDWRRVSRVIFVCKGNICRSPFAEHRFHALGAKVQSAGLEADPGKPANEQAAKVAARHGVDLTPHRSSHVSQLELTENDLLVAFEPAHADALRKLSTPQSQFQVTLLGLWSPAARM